MPVAAIVLVAFSPLLHGAPDTKPAAASPKAAAGATPEPAPSAVTKPSVAPAKPAATPVPAKPPAAVSAAVTPETSIPKTDTPVRLEEIEVTGERVTALTQAPTDSSIDTYQPQSGVNLQFIANNLPPTADFSTIANVAPSVASIVTNGPGLSDARRITVRGIDDTQFNVTYDGIPFSDNGDGSHRSTAYFPAKMIGRVVVDRGPGRASDMGDASFGGTISLYSKDPRTVATVIPTLSYGSYNTSLSHIEGNTGLINSANRASAIASYQYMASDGYQSHVSMRRNTTYFKYVQPIGANTTVYVLSNYNQLNNNLSLPATQAQLNQFGHNFGLTNDPKDTYYFGYNNRRSQNDFEYIGIDSTVANVWHFSDKLYTYRSFIRQNGTASFAKNGDALVRHQSSDWRSVGDYLSVSHDDAHGVAKAGFWVEGAHNPRFQFSSDVTQGGILVTTTANTNNGYYYNHTLDTDIAHVFGEYEWRVNKDLVVDAGAKYVSIKRSDKGPVNTNSRLPVDFSHTDTKTLPYLGANYSLRNDWTVYGQVAQGFVAPRGDYIYVTNAANDRIKPRETTNYQAGTVYKKENFTADFDVYWIDYKNFPVQVQDPTSPSSSDQIYVMASGAYYSGAETEATYTVAPGTSVYLNGSINDAKYKKSKLDVDKVARHTASAGVIYDQRGVFGSLIGKYTGRSKIYNSASFNPDIASSVTGVLDSPGYFITNLALGYSMKINHKFIHSLKVKVEIGNLFDRKVQVADRFSGGVPQFDVLPERNYFLTISSEF